MYSSQQPKLPSNLILTAVLSTGVTIVVSLIYIVLCILGLVYGANCDIGSTTTPSQNFWHTIYNVYVQRESCGHIPVVEGLTQPSTMYVFLSITLSFSLLTLLTSIVLASTIHYKNLYRYMNIIVFAYIGSWVGSLIVDVTLASHLGIDYTYLSNRLDESSTYNAQLDLIRQGTFTLLALSLKGYAAHALNLLFIVFLVAYSCTNQEENDNDVHPVRKHGPVNAYDHPRRMDESWADVYNNAPPFSRGQNNNAFEEEEPRNHARNELYPKPASFNRSDSWHRQPPPTNNPSNNRPFSYLEELQRPVALKPVPSPVHNDPSWRREYNAPPVQVPAPDYSPHQPRRLKSALKPAYY